MKNLISYLFVAFSLFGFSYANANECETYGEVKLSDLKYVGVDLAPMLKKGGACKVVKANTDNEGQNACGPKWAALNPGNPQYLGHDRHGSRMNNTLKYYFCVGMSKRDMCQQRISELQGSMQIEWQQLGKGRNDGDCVCKSSNDKLGKFQPCPVTEAQVDAMKTGNSNGCTVHGASLKDNQCKCDIGGAVVKHGDSCPTTTPTEVTENVDDNDLEMCLADIKTAKEGCSQKSQEAIDKCSKEAPEVNKNIGEAQRVLSIGLDAVIAKNAGTGALNACAKMGAAGTSIIEALSLLKESCKKEINNCRNSCEAIKAFKEKSEEDHVSDCEKKFIAAKKPWTEAHGTRLKEKLAVELNMSENAEKLCKGDAQKGENDLDGFLQELAASVQKADICKCQLTASSNGTSCEEVASPLTCVQNVNQPGCSFSSVGCSPGSTLPTCRNPINAVNPGGSGLGMPASGFAGPGFGSGGSVSGKGGKVGVNAGDVDGFFDESRPTGSGTATADAGSPFGVAGAGGGLGGGGSPGGGGDPNAGSGGDGSGEDKDKSGFAGLFQSAKGGIASLFGGGPDNKGSTSKKPDNKPFKNDVNGFRPKAGVRGMANESPFGTKNRDIWKTMNERYNNEYHTFITVENPSK